MKLKQTLPTNHPGKNALINDLFKEALDKNILVDKWEEFILK